MAIEFHCSHCNKVIKAPADAGGRSGKCPHCGGVNYIPMPEDAGEIPLAPLDDSDERRRQQIVIEDAAYQQRLLRERSLPGEQGGKSAARRTAPAAAPQPSSRVLTSQIVEFVEAMAAGELTRADRLAQQLASQTGPALQLLDELMGEDLSGYGLPALPRPVLLGFLKQLRSRL